jgi:hypothetical protein
MIGVDDRRHEHRGTSRPKQSLPRFDKNAQRRGAE